MNQKLKIRKNKKVKHQIRKKGKKKDQHIKLERT